MEHCELEQIVRREVEDLHEFIVGWFRGDLADDDQTFRSNFAARLDADFHNIQPNGGVLTRDDILGGIRSAHAGNPDFRIGIHEVSLLGSFDNDRVLLATYLESQTGAKNTIPADNDRFSTVLMRRADDGRLTWLHLHETTRP